MKKQTKFKPGDFIECWHTNTTGRVIRPDKIDQNGQRLLVAVSYREFGDNWANKQIVYAFECRLVKRKPSEVPHELWFIDEARAMGLPIIQNNGRAFVPGPKDTKREIINMELKELKK